MIEMMVNGVRTCVELMCDRSLVARVESLWVIYIT